MLEPSHDPVPPSLPHRQPSARKVLETLAYVAVIVGVVAFLGNTAVEYVRAMGATAAASAAGDATVDKMLRHSVTNAIAASTTFTNLQGFTMRSCFKGIVTNKSTREKAESMTVCSGEVKPYSTVTVEAPYDPGAVLKVCEPYSGAGLDWDSCDFTVVEVK